MARNLVAEIRRPMWRSFSAGRQTSYPIGRPGHGEMIGFLSPLLGINRDQMGLIGMN